MFSRTVITTTVLLYCRSGEPLPFVDRVQHTNTIWVSFYPGSFVNNCVSVSGITSSIHTRSVILRPGTSTSTTC